MSDLSSRKTDQDSDGPAGSLKPRCPCDCCNRSRKKLKRRAFRQLATTSFVYRDEEPNNLEHPEWGEADQQLLRAAPPQYADGVSTPAGPDRPSAREISNAIFNQDAPDPNSKGASAIFWLWGQFLDHDLGLTDHATPVEPFPIAVPKGDPYFDPDSTGTQTIPLNRSIWDLTTGTDAANPRQQVNQVSSFLDGSNVYGSHESRTEWLRYGQGGLLCVGMGDMLLHNDGSVPNAMSKSSAFYVGGDVRANEHLGLTCMHTIWTREHNYWAKKLHHSYPEMDDHELYERARVMVEAELQAITINEFLPLLLGGTEVFGKYEGYNPAANPQMRTEFTTAAYRLGHTLVSTPYPRLQENGEPIKAGNLQLRDAYWVPFKLSNEGGVDPILRGLATVVADQFDGKIINDLRNFLFGEPGKGGMDLTALNIQRGRDHGLADYNTTRQAYGLPAISSFSEVISDPEIVAKLEALYGTPDQADLYVVLQVEDHYPNSMLGPTTMAILGEQAIRLRAGDRFWYQTRLPKTLLEYVEGVRLSDVILRNTGIEWIQEKVMEVHPRKPKNKRRCKKK